MARRHVATTHETVRGEPDCCGINEVDPETPRQQFRCDGWEGVDAWYPRSGAGPLDRATGWQSDDVPDVSDLAGRWSREDAVTRRQDRGTGVVEVASPSSLPDGAAHVAIDVVPLA
jgi:hypothetical protein